nr:hypothetical protein [uncultured Selenomonas sp.]
MAREKEKDRLRERIGACLAVRDFDAAMDAVRELAKDEAAQAEALGAAASIHIEAGDYEGAAPLVEALLQKEPQSVYGAFLRARLLFAEGKLLSAHDELAALLQREEGLAPLYVEKICNLLGQTARAMGLAEEAAAAYEKAAAAAETPELRAMAWSNVLFALHFLRVPQEEAYRAHCAYGELFRDVTPFLHRLRQKRRKIRIGYISPDLRRHVVLRFAEAFFTHYDAERFEVYCYQNGPEDEESRRIMHLVDAWRNISPLSPREAARRIYEDGIDVLVDLAGHTRGTALPVLAHRPAPVQMSGVGYFATTGLPAVDYMIGDVWLDGAPAGIKEAPFFTEKLLVLAHTHLCYTPEAAAPPAGAAPCLRKGFVTFGSFNAFAKASDETLAAWAQILSAVPSSRLLLKSAAFSSEEGRTAALARLQAAGIDSERVELRPDTREYLHEYHDVDIALDTFPYPGGGTTFDALYMGVPVVMLKGDSHGTRFGFSILANLGLEDLAAADAADYVRKAAALAEDTELLAALHKNLRPMMEKSPLMDGASYTAALEAGCEAALAAHDAAQTLPSPEEAARLAVALKRFFAAGDLRQALAASDALLAAGRAERDVWRLAAGLYIDAEEGENAARAAGLYLAGGEDGFGFLLRARAVFLLGRWRDALEDVRRALAARQLSRSEQVLAHNLAARICRSLGQVEEALCAEKAAFDAAETLADRAASWSNYLFALHYVEREPQFMLDAARRYGELFQSVPRMKRAPKRRGKIRVGYISPDFTFHIVALFSFAFFTHFDKSRFEVFGYSLAGENAMAAELSSHATAWRYVGGGTAAEIAERIRADEIDILVDLAGHSANNALPVLALRPAPVQISGVGYFDTTGLSAADYFLTDVHIDPPGENDGCFTEKLLRLPESHLCYRASRAGEKSRIAPLPAWEKGYITFGSFNNFAKVTDKVLHLWAKILRAVPRSRLFLKTAVFDAADGRQEALRRLEAAGIDLARVKTEGHTAEYLAAYGEVDVALDTFPYPGGGTTCDALYMGVPVVTWAGARHGARFGASILKNIGLADACCARTADEYAEKACALAADAASLAVLRRTLRTRMEASPLMDAARYMLHLEAAYEKIWAQKLGEDSKKQRRKLVPVLQAETDAAFAARDWRSFLAAAHRLVALDAASSRLWMSMGFASLQLEEPKKARCFLEMALEKAQEERPEILQLLAEAQKLMGDHAAALASAEEAQARTEKTRETRPFRHRLALAEAHAAYMLARADEASRAYREAADLADDLRARTEAYSSHLLALHNTAIGQEELFAAHRGYEKLLAGVEPLAECAWKNHEKIRIGYLSPDFRRHVMFSFIYGLFVRFDRAHFEVCAYSLAEEEDGFTAALKERATAWRNVAGLSFAEIAERIRADEIDVLVDLAGHSAGGALPVLAYRPAPVQVSGLGYVNTTGLSAVDYFLTDDVADPPGRHDALFTEEPVCLTSQFLYTAKSDVSEPSGAPSRKAGHVVFGVFNHWYKVTEEMLFCWREIMERVPKSRLLVKCQELFAPEMREEALRRMAKSQIDIGRVDLEPATSDYMERYLTVDIALDTYPYPGGGTTCDALYMGVPVVTRYGRRRGTRFGLSLLKNAGLESLAAADARAYIEKAAALAHDAELLDGLHRQLRARFAASPVMRATGYMEELERFYRMAVKRKKGEEGEA